MDEQMYAITLDSLEDSLEHHGTKGMRWGVRRFQNKDGSLTPLGQKRRSLGQVYRDHKTAKKRKAALEKAREAKAKKKVEEEKAAKAAEKRAKDVAAGKIPAKKMTDEELATAMKRLENEQKYQQKLLETSKSKQFMDKMWKDAILPGISEGSKEVLKSTISKYGKDLLGVSDKDAKKAKSEYDKLKEQKEMAEFREKKYAAERNLKNLKEKDAEAEQQKAEGERKAAAQKKVDEYNAQREKEAREREKPDVTYNKKYTDAGKSAVSDFKNSENSTKLLNDPDIPRSARKGEQFIQDPQTGEWLDVTELD